MKMCALFLRGLNTYGDDDLHLGPARLGPMHSPWQKALRAHGFDVFAPGGLGLHDPEKQAEAIATQLVSTGWSDADGHFIVGHSTGGLTARALAKLCPGKTLALVTVGTPHLGTEAASFARSVQSRLPFLHKTLAAVGYDTSKRSEIFELFTPEAIARFNERHPLPKNIACAHALCEKPMRDVSWPLLALYRQLHSSPGTKDRSDGFIHSQSQAFGFHLGTYALDHFENLGFFISPNPQRRAAAKAEFDRLVAETCAYFKRSVSN